MNAPIASPRQRTSGIVDEGNENKTFLASHVQPSDTAANLTGGPA